MKTISTKKNIPELRFPGFSSGWEETKLGEVATFSKGKNLSKDALIEDGKNECIRYGELYTLYLETIEDVESRTNLETKESFLSKKNDILSPSSGETALDIATFSCLKKESVILGGDINVIRLKSKEGGVFFAYYLSNKKRKDIARLAQGNSVVHIYNSHLKSLLVKFPGLEEQKRIADFLTNIDELVKSLKTQKDKLEEYKRGMMQKIFLQEMRFKDENGKDFPEWEEVKLRDAFKKRSARNSRSECKNVLTNSAQYGVVNQSEYFDKDIANQDNLINYCVVETDDFVYNPRISRFALVGPLKRNKNGRGVMSPLYTILTLNKGDLGFYEYYFDTNLWHRYMFKISNFGARHDRMNIRNEDFMKMPIPFPHKKEQEKISDFLLDIDKLITAKVKQIEKVETWKKGLLQKMFV